MDSSQYDYHTDSKMSSHSMAGVLRFCLLALGSTSVLADYYSSSDQAPTATVESGQLIGKSTSLPNALGLVNQFLGVPFAAPPVRFSPPQPAAAFHEPNNATVFKPACVQQFQCAYYVVVGATCYPLMHIVRSTCQLTTHPTPLQQPTTRRVGRLSLSQCLCTSDVGRWYWKASVVLDLWWLTQVRQCWARHLRRQYLCCIRRRYCSNGQL